MPTPFIRVGVVGSRFGAMVHVPAFRADSRCEVVALAGLDIDRTRTAARTASVSNCYADWHELIADADVDAIGIAVPPFEQPAIVQEAARHGKHVFCEKPLGASVADAEAALDCVRRAGVVHAMDFLFPEIPAWQRARALLREGAIGVPRHFSYRWQTETYASRFKMDSWKTREGDGGGAIGNFLSHVIFNLEWLLGGVVNIESLMPRSQARASSSCDCVVSLADGVHGPVSIATDAFLGSGHEVVVFGDAGTLMLRNRAHGHYADGFELSVGTRDSGAFEVISSDVPQSSTDGRIAVVHRIVRRFVDAIQAGGQVTPNLEDGVRVQHWLQRVTRDRSIAMAAAGGRPA